MTTIGTIRDDHFRGHRNINEGQRQGTDATLDELLAQIKVDIIALEAFKAGLQDPKDSVRVATAAALPACTAAGSGAGKTLTADAVGALTVDGVAVALGDRILVQNQVAGKDNGIYTVTTLGTGAVEFVLTRAVDADSSAEVTAGMAVPVAEGTANADKIFHLTTNDPIVLDTTALVFAEISAAVHAAAHILGGGDPIDADQLDVDMTPTNYTPDAGVPEAGNADHLAAHLGGIDNELGTLHAKTGAPAVRGFRAAGGTLSADGTENATVLGADLLQGQPYAQATLGASLDIIAEEPGSPGHALSVEVVDTGGAGPSTVAYAAGKLTIDLVGLTPDEDAIATLVNTSGAWDGILRANSGGGPAFGVAAETALSGGGTGTGVKVYVGGGLCTPVGEAGGGATSSPAYTEVSLVVDVPDLTGLTPALAATTDDAAIWVESNGKTSNSLSKTLA